MVVTRVEMDRIAWLVVERVVDLLDFFCEKDNTKVIVTDAKLDILASGVKNLLSRFEKQPSTSKTSLSN